MIYNRPRHEHNTNMNIAYMRFTCYELKRIIRKILSSHPRPFVPVPPRETFPVGDEPSRVREIRDLRENTFPITVIERRFVTLVRPLERGFTWLITERGRRIASGNAGGGLAGLCISVFRGGFVR